MVKAVAVLGSSEGVTGTIHFNQDGNGKFPSEYGFVILYCTEPNEVTYTVNCPGPTTVTGSIAGLKPGLHGFHVHALGDTTNGCLSTGIVFTQ